MATQNKFARIAEQNIKKARPDEQMSVERRLAKLEDDIRRLKIEFDMYFNGALKRAPHDTKNRVESTIKRLGDDRSLTFAQKYHYNSLVARYASFRELWRRTTREREEGRGLAATRAARIEKEAEKNLVKDFSCGNVRGEAAKVQDIYEHLLQAKKLCGEDTTNFGFENFFRQLVIQSDKFKQSTDCREIKFTVGVEEGKVLFRARAV